MNNQIDRSGTTEITTTRESNVIKSVCSGFVHAVLIVQEHAHVPALPLHDKFAARGYEFASITGKG